MLNYGESNVPFERAESCLCLHFVRIYRKNVLLQFWTIFYEQQHLFDFASSEVSGCDPQSADTSPGGPREPPKPRAAVPPT